jgi:hypoxanthine-guanine phosphoribosyltransferase
MILKTGHRNFRPMICYVGFGIGDEFVVGYGLDDQGIYRSMP